MTHCKHATGTGHSVPSYPYKGPLKDLLGCYVRLGRHEDGMMWVRVERVEDETVFARVDNEPVVIEGMNIGDMVQFGRPEIEEVLRVH